MINIRGQKVPVTLIRFLEGVTVPDLHTPLERGALETYGLGESLLIHVSYKFLCFGQFAYHLSQRHKEESIVRGNLLE